MYDLVIETVIKATVLVGVAGVLAVCLRRAAAARRHLLWALTLGAVLVLPAAETAIPAWRVLPVAPVRPAAAGAAVVARPGALTPAPRPTARPGAPTAATQAWPQPGALTSPAAAAPWTAARILALLWLVGAGLVLGAFALTRARVGVLGRRATPIAAAEWLELRDTLSAQIGLRRPVRLVVTREAAMPMTWGIWRPVVLLPAEADGWPAARRRDVLLHELAHVQRRDCLTHLLAMLACAAYWFHPLVWVAARRLRIERERACDDQVLAAGSKPSEYAQLLLELARSLRVGSAYGLASLAMARPSQLTGRLLDVLGRDRRREPLTRRTALPAALGAALVVLPLAALRPAAIAVVPDNLRPATLAKPRTARPTRTLATSVADSCRAGHSSSRSSQHQNDHRLWLSFSENGCVVELTATADFKLTDDFTDIAEIDDGGSVVVEQRTGDTRRRVTIRPATGGLERRWYVNDIERPYDAEARAWLKATLTELLRRTGYAAEARSQWILETRGVDGVFEEIAQLEGDYSRRIYYQALVADGKAAPATVTRVVTQAGSELSSAYDLAELLVLVGRVYPLSDPLRAAFVAAADHLDSDYERHRVLAVVLAGRNLPDEVASAVLASAGGISSDYDLAEVLIVLMGKHPITEGMREAFFRAVDGIDSDYDRHRVLATLLAQNPPAAPSLVAAAVRSAGRISSDYDRAEVLTQVATSYEVDEAVREPFFAATDQIGSDYDHARVLTALAERPRLSPSILASYIASARRIASSSDRAGVLIALAQSTKLTPELRRAYVEAANEIDSDYDRTRALAALAGSAQLD